MLSLLRSVIWKSTTGLARAEETLGAKVGSDCVPVLMSVLRIDPAAMRRSVRPSLLMSAARTDEGFGERLGMGWGVTE